MQRWSALIRPALPSMMRLANLPVASMFLNMWGIPSHHAPELFLQPTTRGWTGLVNCVPTMVIVFVSTYIGSVS